MQRSPSQHETWDPKKSQLFSNESKNEVVRHGNSDNVVLFENDIVVRDNWLTNLLAMSLELPMAFPLPQRYRLVGPEGQRTCVGMVERDRSWDSRRL